MRLSPQPWMDSSCARVFDAIAAAGGEARYVGGCVRDALLGRSGGDVDIACTLHPERVMDALAAADIKAIPTGIAHGTVTAICQSKPYEITTLRRDEYCDGRHAEVRFTDDWQEDAARRDFTMNALYANADGTIYDYFGGIEDARNGQVRFIGDAAQRIHEDGLRILRFFRFFAHYGQWPMDSHAVVACAAHATMLTRLSGERIQAEMFKLLSSQQAPQVLEVMQAQGILAPTALPAPNLAVLGRLNTSDSILRLAALLQGGDTEAVLQRWKLSNADKSRLRALANADLGAPAHWDEWEQKKMLRALGRGRFDDWVRLAMAVHPQQDLQALLALAAHWQLPLFPVSGRDLLQKGVPQGKPLGDTLQRLEAEWEAAHYQPDKADLLSRI
jgi:poly(A) polymerase